MIYLLACYSLTNGDVILYAASMQCALHTKQVSKASRLRGSLICRAPVGRKRLAVHPTLPFRRGLLLAVQLPVRPLLSPPDPPADRALQHQLHEAVVRSHVEEEHRGHLPPEARGPTIVWAAASQCRDFLTAIGRGADVGRRIATVGGVVGQPRVTVDSLCPPRHVDLLLPHHDLGPEEAAADTSRGEGCEHGEIPGCDGLGRVAVHAVDAIELAGVGQAQPEEREDKDPMHQVDAPVPDDVAAEGTPICVDVGGGHQRKEEHQHAYWRVVVVTPQHPHSGQQMETMQGVQVCVPILVPHQPLRCKICDQRGQVGKHNGRDRPRPQQRGGGPEAREPPRGLGLRHGPDHEDADAQVHGDPDIFAEAQGRPECQNRPNTRQCKAIDHEVLEGCEVRGQTGSAFSNKVHGGLQRLAVTA
mmetsp:Transcript_59801/g.144455  ORF Transcript_59801/g.144455 Transcript_59801/m.144455 type:complete len:417 (+) Transcript_59801:266-1516(+)